MAAVAAVLGGIMAIEASPLVHDHPLHVHVCLIASVQRAQQAFRCLTHHGNGTPQRTDQNLLGAAPLNPAF